jgi:hypothetical protein
MTKERWHQFSKREQLLAIFAELERARVWQNKNENNFKNALERALLLIDFSINAQQWKGQTLTLWVLRNEVARFYIRERTDSIQWLSAAI